MLKDDLTQTPYVHRLAAAHLDSQRFFAEHIDGGQCPEFRAISKLVRDDVHARYLIGFGGSDTYLAAYDYLAASGQRRAQLQLLLLIQAKRLVPARLPAFAFAQHMDAAVNLPYTGARDFMHALPRRGLSIFHALVLLRAACLLDQRTGPAQLQAVVTDDVVHYFSLHRRPPHFLMRHLAGWLCPDSFWRPAFQSCILVL